MNQKAKKSMATKVVEKVILKVADFYSGVMCIGRWYEPKMPEKLKK